MLSFALVYLFLSPITYGIVNLLDKYILSSRIKYPMSYVVVVGCVHMALGFILTSFIPLSSWLTLTSAGILASIVIGMLYALQLIIYYHMFSREDVTNIVGIDYLYPLVVAVLSWFFLGERLGFAGYVGLVLAVLGTWVLTARMIQFSKKSVTGEMILLLAIMIVNTGVYEFLIKIATPLVPQFNLLVINSFVAGLCVLVLCTKRSVRTHLRESFARWRWAVFIEGLTIVAILFIILAMSNFPATIASVVATLQPLVVLIGEWIISRTHKNYAKDTALGYKTAGIVLICIGTSLALWQVL